MIKKNINKILSFSFMFGLLGISSYAKDIKTDNTPPVISYTEEQIGDREALRVTVTATDESGIREFRDHNGNVIVGNTTTVEFNRRENSTFTAIDNAGNESNITVNLSWINPYTSYRKEVYPARVSGGASYWSSSNIREWLNSSSKIVSYTNNPPTDENTYNRGYANEPGFLNEFSKTEIDAIAVTERVVWLYKDIDPKPQVSGNGDPGHFNETMPITLSNNLNQVLNYKQYSHYVEKDKVYLASPFEIYWYMERRGFEIKKKPTTEAQNKHNKRDQYLDWRLTGTTIGESNSEYYYCTNGKGRFVITDANSPLGIVPIVNIKPDYIMNNGLKASDLSIGDTVEFGTYLGAPVIWTVINISDNNSPMLISDKILDFKMFDAKGDEARLYSDYINYDDSDINLVDNLQYKSTKMQEDVDIPTGEVLNEEVLNIRHNGSFFVDLKFEDSGSGIDYIKKPDGTITIETEFSYEISENNNYVFEIIDKAGNYNQFGIPVGNINDKASLKIEPVSYDWTNNGSVYIESSNTIRDVINDSTDGKLIRPILPNYISYNNVTFKVCGIIEVLSVDSSLITDEEGFVNIGFIYDTRGPSNGYTYTSARNYDYSLSNVKVKYENGYQVYFENEVTVPKNYLRNLRPAMETGKEQGLNIKFENVEYYLEDDSNFEITSIVLPNGTEINNIKSYTDIIEEDGIHNLTYKVLDSRGLTTEKTVTVKVDKTKPILNLNYNYDKFDFLSNKSLLVNISGSDALSGFKRIKLPDGNYTSSSNATYTITDYGAHVFECEDIAGNVTRETIVVEDMSVFEDTERLVEVAEQTRNSQDISNARDAVNNLPESSKKDELQDRLNTITNISDITFDKKSATSNIDVYIKSENMLLMSLSTNNITFNDYSGVDDMELNNAINISINSSLPYQLNSYLLSEIENSGKSNRIEKDLLNIKSNIDNNYKTFNDINEKLVLEDDCDAGNNKSHSIDLKLKGSQAHEADIYKTVIKFEAEQK